MSTEQQDMVAEEWDREVQEKAGSELAASEAVVRKILDKEGLSGRQRLARGLALSGEVMNHLDPAITNHNIDLRRLQERIEAVVEDPLLREAVLTSGRLLHRIQTDTSVMPGLRNSYLLEPFERASLPPMQPSPTK